MVGITKVMKIQDYQILALKLNVVTNDELMKIVKTI